MASSFLSVQVLNLSPSVNLSQLADFFSYCGALEGIELHSTGKGQSQSALVTFRDPFAYQTALLLNEAAFARQQIQVVPANNSAKSPVQQPNEQMKVDREDNKAQSLIPTLQTKAQAMVCEGTEMVNKARGEIRERQRALVDQTRSMVSTAKLVAGEYVSGGATWLSTVFEKASKRVSGLGTSKKDNPNSRKQK